MSQAFVREGEEPQLNEIMPTLQALIMYLSRQNNGIPVRVEKTYEENDREIFQMSNGMSYGKNSENQWEIVGF